MTVHISLHVVIPTLFIIPTSAVAVNGSSATGNCSLVLIFTDTETPTCFNPTSSVLLDGVVPEFIDKEDDMWARDLFTLQSTTSNSLSIEIRFDNIPDNTGVGRIEVVLFQCLQCGIYVETISITDTDNAVFGSTNLSLSSCDSLVRVCIEVDIQGVDPFLLVIFSSPASFTTAQAYIAEVTFYNSSSSTTNSVCPVAEEIVTTEITANTDEMTDEMTDYHEMTNDTDDHEMTDDTDDHEMTDDIDDHEMTDETTNGSAMTREAFIILTSITATLATVINYNRLLHALGCHMISLL